MQAGRQAPLQIEAGTSPAPVVQERGWQKAIFERALRPETRGEGAENATSGNHQGTIKEGVRERGRGEGTKERVLGERKGRSRRPDPEVSGSADFFRVSFFLLKFMRK